MQFSLLVRFSREYQVWKLLTIISFLQLALYCWLSVFWSQAHKEERFLFPIYPLIVVAGAISVDTIQKLWYHFFVKVQKKHYLDHTTWISLFLIGLSILLSIMRMVALYKNYHASMDIWMHVNHLSHTDEFPKGNCNSQKIS